jgi:pimeloyl-ACP methyl ester carboxylesterase
MDNLLLLHGALGSKKQFSALEKFLSEKFNVYSLDFTGHGGNTIPDEPFSIRMFSADILEWLNHKGIEKINIFGYSMGGYAALYLARHNHERVEKIFTLATKFEWTEEIAAREVKMLDAAKIKEKVPKFAEELKQRHQGQDWEKVLDKTSEMMKNLGKHNELSDEDYAEIKNEVMVGVGDTDKMVTLEETISVYRRLKNGRLIVLPETPHPLEQVDMVRLGFEIERFFL